MVYYAYEDEERTIEVWAENVNDDNKLEHYFCPTENCEARMSIRNIHSDRAAYFVANPSAPHSDFFRINCCASPTQYDERYGNGDGQIRLLTTVRQLYSRKSFGGMSVLEI